MKILLWSQNVFLSAYLQNELVENMDCISVTSLSYEVDVLESYIKSYSIVILLFSKINQDEIRKVINFCETNQHAFFYVIYNEFHGGEVDKYCERKIRFIPSPFTPILNILNANNELIEDTGELYIDFKQRVINKGGQLIDLSERESELLMFLFKNRKKPINSKRLLCEIWNDMYSDANLYITIQKIRRKIEDNPSKPRYLINIKGSGYMLNI